MNFNIDDLFHKSNAVKRLSQHEPICSQDSKLSVLDSLVLEACASSGSLIILTSEDIKSFIDETYTFNYEIEEIDKSGEFLKSINKVDFTPPTRNSYSTFRITQEIEESVNREGQIFFNLEKSVLMQWKKDLIEKYQDYNIVKENIDSIVSNLQHFITKIFISHGIESVALLYPDDPTTDKWLESVKMELINELPKYSGFVDNICLVEIPKFFITSDKERIKYITNLFNSSYMWHLMSIDESCKKLIKEVTKGQRLFLDNNILFSLIGIHGKIRFNSVHKMLEMANSLDYELWVTTKTLDEFHNALDLKLKKYKSFKKITSEMAKLAMEYLDTDSFLISYWEEFFNNGITIEEFVHEKSHIHNVLKGLEIQIFDEFREEIESDEVTLKKEMEILSQVCHVTSENVLEHDAFHRILINKLRGDHKYNYNQAIAWFITHDSKLPAYGRKARNKEKYLPFCLTTSQWIQINRPLISRISDKNSLEESFHSLVTQPYLRSFMSKFSLEKNVKKVLERLSKFKNQNPQLMARFFTDKQFILTNLSKSLSDEEIIEEIDNEILDIASEYESEALNLKEEVTKKTGEIDILRNQVKSLNSNFDQFKKESEKDKDEFKKDIKELKSDFKDKKDELEKRSEVNISKLKQKYNWIFFIILLTFSSIFLWSHTKWLDWAWLDNNPNQLIFKLSSQILLIFIYMNIPQPKHWAKFVPLVIAIVLAIFGFALK